MWFNDFNASALFLEGDYVAVFGTMWNYYSNSVDYTFIKILDVSNRGNPFWVREFKVAGKYFDGRKLSNGFMYLVTNYEFTRSYQPIPWFDAGIGSGRIDLDFSSIFWYPSFVYIRPSAINILSFNLANPIGSRKKVVTICSESAGVMYMSERYIYLAINTTLNGVAYTQLRKIFVWDSYIIPFADGLVIGTIKNQFSLDEYNFFLRIATTDWSANNVFVLDYFLQPYGKLTNIAPNERIESCRFVGKRLYLVTFRTEDPFFVISFSNHRLPKILGELHISGVSTYLHPYDETTIIGIGRSTDSTTARRLGLKIELFDVSNVASPKSNFLF
jgi:inhibitor of cysteine peptidase